jgi:hypothetical protein
VRQLALRVCALALQKFAANCNFFLIVQVWTLVTSIAMSYEHAMIQGTTSMISEAKRQL